MKIVLYTILICACNVAYSQIDCKALESFRIFHGIKFGQPFPDSLRKYCDISYNPYRADSSFNIWEDKIKQYPKFASWVNFALDFSSVSFQSITNGKVYNVVLLRNLDSEDSTYLNKNQFPFFYEAVTKELVSMFGDDFKIAKEQDITRTYSRIWECEKMKIILSFDSLGFYSLMITDKQLEKLRKTLKYSQ